MSEWRVFVGAHNGEWAHVDHAYPDYGTARSALAEQIRPFLDDTCETCRTVGTEELARLQDLTEDVAYTGEIDGEAYVLIEAGSDLDAALS